LFVCLYSALKIFLHTKGGPASNRSEMLSQLQEVLVGVQQEENKWREVRTSSDRLGYEQEVMKLLKESSKDLSSVFTSVDEAAVSMETADSDEAERDDSNLTYSDLVENMTVPVVVDSLRNRIDCIVVRTAEAASSH